MANQTLSLTRDQFASFLNDFEQIKQFERLFANTNANVISIDDVSIAAGSAGASANDALAQIIGLAELLNKEPSDQSPELVAAINELRQELETTPRNELGTMAALQQANIPWLTFDNSPESTPTTIGSIYWNGGTTINVQMTPNVIQRIGENLYYYIKASAAITKGQVIMFDGAVGASGVLKGKPATAITNGSYIMGIASETIAHNDFGLVQINGPLQGVDTSAFLDGDVLWYNPAVTGGLTKTEPLAPNVKVQVATVARASNNGTIVVRITAGSTLGGTDSNVQFGTLANNDLIQYDNTLQYWKNVPASSISIGTATALSGGAANRIAYQTAPNVTGFIVAPTSANTYLEWSGSAFQWSANPLGTVTSVAGTGTVSGITLTGTVTTSGSLTLGGTLSVTAANFSSQTANTFLAAPNGSAGVPTFRAIVAADVPTLNQNTTGTASNVTGTVAIANGGTGAITAPLARTALGATTVGGNVFTLTNPSAITFPRFNADNTVSALDAATFRTAIGAGTSSTTGTVTSVSGTGTVNGITLTGTVTSSGSLTLGGTLGGIANSQLTNSSITINGSAISLGGTVSVGTVTSASVVSANGFAGTVATATTTPAITLTTTITGVLKGNGTAISAATADVDYIAPSAPVTKTANFTVAVGETWILNNKSGSTCTVTLPSAATYPGRYLTFQNNQDQSLVSASSNVIPQGGGAAGTAILTNVSGNWATLVSNGTNWVIMQAASFNNLLF